MQINVITIKTADSTNYNAIKATWTHWLFQWNRMCFESSEENVWEKWKWLKKIFAPKTFIIAAGIGKLYL